MDIVAYIGDFLFTRIYWIHENFHYKCNVMDKIIPTVPRTENLKLYLVHALKHMREVFIGFFFNYMNRM